MLNRSPRLPVAVLTIALMGCDDGEPSVRAYKTPKEARPVPASKPAARDLAPAAVAANSIEWDLPAGWKREPNPNTMRFATLSAGEGDQRIEIAVSQLGGSAGGTVANINRWRGQIGLEPATEDEMHAALEEITARGTKGLLIDMTGKVAEGSSDVPQGMLVAMFPTGPRTWFIKTTAPEPAIAAQRDAFKSFCQSIRLEGASPHAASGHAARQSGHAARPNEPAPKASKPSTPQWELPDGWQEDAKPRTMSVASFTIAQGEQKASMTITPLGGTQPLLGNIQRWRSQAGLEPIENLDAEPPTKIEVAGKEAHYVDLPGPKQHILGVIVEGEGKTWFYKLTGPDPLVAKQKGAFEAFMRSVRFDGEPG